MTGPALSDMQNVRAVIVTDQIFQVLITGSVKILKHIDTVFKLPTPYLTVYFCTIVYFPEGLWETRFVKPNGNYNELKCHFYPRDKNILM